MPAPKPKRKPAAAPPPHDPGRFVSQSRLGEVLQRNRATIRQWQADGMPCVRRGDRDAGSQWLYDVAEVVAWREAEVAKRARAEAVGVPADGEALPVGHPLNGVEPKDRQIIQRYVNLALAPSRWGPVNDVDAI